MMRSLGTYFKVVFFSLFAIWSGCKDPNPMQQNEEDVLSSEVRLAMEIDSIDQYIKSKGYDSVFVTDSELRIIPVRDGTGKQVQFGDIITIRQTGMLLNGNIFETTNEDLRNELNYFGVGTEPTVVNFPNPSAAEGLNEAYKYMKEGTKFILLIPSYIGFGSTGRTFIGVQPNSILIYEVTLINIRR